MEDHPEKFVELLISFPSDKWDWRALSKEGVIPLDLIFDHLKYKGSNDTLQWHWDVISQRGDLKPNHFWDHLTLPWNFDEISRRYDLYKPEQVIANRGLKWNWDLISMHDDIDCAFVRAHPEIKITSFCLAEVSRIKAGRTKAELKDKAVSRLVELLHLVREKCHQAGWRWDILSAEDVFSMDQILEPPLIENWDWHIISQRADLKPEHIKNYPDIKWDYEKIGRRYNLYSLDLVLERPQASWESSAITNHPDMTFEFIRAHLDLIDINGLSNIYHNRRRQRAEQLKKQLPATK